MLAIAGTIPDINFPLTTGEVTLHGDCISIQGNTISVNRGTAALLAAAIKTCEAIGQPTPIGFLAGDTGLGHGSRKLYEHLIQQLGTSNFSAIVFHYILPDVDLCNRVMFALDDMARRPLLIADAGFMYVAKMAGQAPAFDLFTPDAGELAFLADEEAPHPFYTRGFILQDGLSVPDLIARAYEHENSSRYLLVKGRTDHVANKEGIIATVNQPMVEEMEPIGGTGDTITGIVSALIAGGMKTDRAALIAVRVNRLAGQYAKPTPATQVAEIIAQIPRALADVLSRETKS
jgi:NAD(P)H-hydrate repair Nnr-like enzyme with NAD(P)H-hydrate dehydratase domain